MEQSDQDSGSNCNNSARQSDFSVPAVVVEAKMESSSGREMKQSHYVLGSQDRREEDLPSQPQTPPSVIVNVLRRDRLAMASLERNPDAFKPKIAGSPRGLNPLQVSSCYFNFKRLSFCPQNELGYN
ncbi:unnamed protein product [Brassica oleracea]